MQEASQCEWKEERSKLNKLLKDSEEMHKSSLAALQRDKTVSIGELSHRILQTGMLTFQEVFLFGSCLSYRINDVRKFYYC